MNWSNFPEKELRPLINNPRSPFFDVDVQTMRNILEASNADLIDTGASDALRKIQATDSRKSSTRKVRQFPEAEKSDMRTDGGEGTILMFQDLLQNRIFIPINGSIVIFAPRRHRKIEGAESGKKSDERSSKLPIQLGHSVHIQTLMQAYSYTRSIYPGELCGQIGFLTACFERLGRKSSSMDYSKRRNALVSSYILKFVGKWSNYGFATPKSKIISLDFKALLNLLFDEQAWGKAVNSQPVGICRTCGHLSDKYEPIVRPLSIIRRAAEDSVIRHRQDIYREALLGMGQYDRALAGHLYDISRGRQSRSITLKNSSIAWYLKIPREADVPRLIRATTNKDDTRGFWRDSQTGSKFTIDRKKLITYYRLK